MVASTAHQPAFRVGMLSGGEASWAAMKLDAQRRGIDGLTLLFCDTKEEDPDTYRFLRDSAANIGAPLVKIADGRSIWEVFRDERAIGNTRMDICSKVLKREMADKWLRGNRDPADTVVLLGYTVEEEHRFRKAKSRYAANGWRCEAPLCEPPYISAGDIKRWARAEGLAEQALYREGFHHANCAGACVKAGHAAWRHLLLARPEVYARWERNEDDMRAYLQKDVSVLRDRRGGRTTPLPLRAFRERIEAGGQCDLFDTQVRGATHPCSRLTPDNVRTIRQLASAGESDVSIAKRYKMHKATIRLIRVRKTWKSVD